MKCSNEKNIEVGLVRFGKVSEMTELMKEAATNVAHSVLFTHSMLCSYVKERPWKKREEV